MSYKKPCRICNKTTLVMPDAEPAITATLMEIKDRYELRIRIPDAGMQRYTLVIAEGSLYLYEENKIAAEEHGPLCCFILPANVLPSRITAFCRSYGIKVIMPRKKPDGIFIRVPVQKEVSA